MNILHADTNPPMLTRLRQMLRSARYADIAVGYFFVSGFAQVADEISDLNKTRILVGRADRKTLEAVAAGMNQAAPLSARLERDGVLRRSDREDAAASAAASVKHGVGALPQTDETQSAMDRLRQLVGSGLLEIRAYPREFMHAKAYLCWYPEGFAERGAAIVGSSNFTLAGFSGNTELNVRVTGDAEMAALKEWFNDLWEDSVDISAEVTDILNRSWALKPYPPYMVYLKALYELYYDEIGKDDLPLQSERAELANFQKDAVARALSMIEAHGGCYIGDVVGLGKTYVGAELLRQLRMSYPSDGHPLIICPASLAPMWESFSEQFDLGAAVLSQSAIAAPDGAEYDEERGIYLNAAVNGRSRGRILQDEYPNRGPVLVDEAHNFRNLNKRYAGLSHYLESGDHKVILMSATPQNLGPDDIYRQLSLFMPETDHGLSIDPPALSDYFSCAAKWAEHRSKMDNYDAEYAEWRARGGPDADDPPPEKPDAPQIPNADLSQVLTPIFIRRRRKDIKELYGDSAEVNGQPVRFPTPSLSNVEYRLDKVYAKAGSFNELLDLLARHAAARYLPGEYIKPECVGKPQYEGILRAKNRVANLMRALLVKRLESSVNAFRATLDALIASNRNFTNALKSGKVVVGSAAGRIISGETLAPDAVIARIAEEEARQQASGNDAPDAIFPAADFAADQWLADLDADYATLSEIRDRVRRVADEDDDKFRALQAFLRRKDARGEKLLIFSEAIATVEYLRKRLEPAYPKGKVARLTGDHRSADIIRRFAPKNNSGRNPVNPADEIQILIATDVVSEGQNLQDCARILNYDLHWNPVRLIQRFGRIDRIGSEHDRINLHNMWPDTALDEQLDLTERLHNRIQSFHNIIGLDSKLLSEAERLNENAIYGIYVNKDASLLDSDDGLDEVAINQRAIASLQRIRDENPELWTEVADLPDGIRSALQARRTAPKQTPPQQTAPQTEVAAIHGSQDALPIHGGQQPLKASAAPGAPAAATAMPRSPFDDPSAGETLVMLADGGIKSCYAVGADLAPRQISAAQFAAAAECAPDEPAQPLPLDTNKRVMAAASAFSAGMERRSLSAARRRPDTRNSRYLSRQLNAARETLPPTYSRRIDILRRVFVNSPLQPQVDRAATEIRNLGVEGEALVRRLEALRERYRINPADAPQPDAPAPRIMRIVCSDGLV